MKTILLGFLLLTAINSFGQKSSTKIITVEPSLNVQYGWAAKMLGLQSDNNSVDYIKGFEFEWGYHYELKIKETKLKNPPMDGSSIKHSLVKVVSKTKVADDYEFKLRLERDLYLGPGDQVNNFVEINDSTFSYFNKIEIEVPENLKSEFYKVRIDGTTKTGVFMFLSNSKIKLVRLESN